MYAKRYNHGEACVHRGDHHQWNGASHEVMPESITEPRRKKKNSEVEDDNDAATRKVAQRSRMKILTSRKCCTSPTKVKRFSCEFKDNLGARENFSDVPRATRTYPNQNEPCSRAAIRIVVLCFSLFFFFGGRYFNGGFCCVFLFGCWGHRFGAWGPYVLDRDIVRVSWVVGAFVMEGGHGLGSSGVGLSRERASG